MLDTKISAQHHSMSLQFSFEHLWKSSQFCPETTKQPPTFQFLDVTMPEVSLSLQTTLTQPLSELTPPCIYTKILAKINNWLSIYVAFFVLFLTVRVIGATELAEGCTNNTWNIHFRHIKNVLISTGRKIIHIYFKHTGKFLDLRSRQAEFATVKRQFNEVTPKWQGRHQQ